MVKKAKFNLDDFMEQQVASLDVAIEAIDAKLAPYQKYINKRNQLMAARRALLNEGRVTGGTGTKVTLDEVLKYFKDNAGDTPSQAAEALGVTQTVISSHIYRNKDRFIRKDGGVWARDPEAGLNDADDIEEDDD